MTVHTAFRRPFPSAAAAALAAALAFSPLQSRAWSIFSSEQSRRFEAAEAAAAAAEEARREGRVMDEIEFLSEAGRTLASLADGFPDYKADEVFAMRVANAERMRTLMTAVRSGEIAVPEPDAAWRGEDAASVEQPADRGESADDGPAFRQGIPQLVRVEAPAAPAPQAEEKAAPEGAGSGAEAAQPLDAETERRLSSPIENPFFKGDAAAPAPDAVPPAGPSVSVTVSESPASAPDIALATLPPLDEAAGDEREGERLRYRAIAEKIRTARAPDAVIELEDILESEGDRAPLAARVLFARALLECRNYRRAREALDSIPPFADADPSVRSLRAATFLATGKLEEALLQLDLLLGEHPEWSDAYVDCAYVMLLLNPRENREDAIWNYRKGLCHGARRDARLERELGIKVGE